MSDHRWVSVLLTSDNTEELAKLVKIEESDIVKEDLVVSYVLHRQYYVMCDRLGEPHMDIILPNFDLLPEVITLYNIGMSIQDIRITLNIPYEEVDYLSRG